MHVTLYTLLTFLKFHARLDSITFEDLFLRVLRYIPERYRYCSIHKDSFRRDSDQRVSPLDAHSCGCVPTLGLLLSTRDLRPRRRPTTRHGHASKRAHAPSFAHAHAHARCWKGQQRVVNRRVDALTPRREAPLVVVHLSTLRHAATFTPTRARSHRCSPPPHTHTHTHATRLLSADAMEE